MQLFQNRNELTPFKTKHPWLDFLTLSFSRKTWNPRNQGPSTSTLVIECGRAFQLSSEEYTFHASPQQLSRSPNAKLCNLTPRFPSCGCRNHTVSTSCPWISRRKKKAIRSQSHLPHPMEAAFSICLRDNVLVTKPQNYTKRAIISFLPLKKKKKKRTIMKINSLSIIVFRNRV